MFWQSPFVPLFRHAVSVPVQAGLPDDDDELAPPIPPVPLEDDDIVPPVPEDEDIVPPVPEDDDIVPPAPEDDEDIVPPVPEDEDVVVVVLAPVAVVPPPQPTALAKGTVASAVMIMMCRDVICMKPPVERSLHTNGCGTRPQCTGRLETQWILSVSRTRPQCLDSCRRLVVP
jgi:hypothetical protein